MLIYISLIIIISLIICKCKFTNNNVQQTNINKELLDIKYKFNLNKKKIIFNKNNIIPTANKTKENITNLFNYIFYNSKIKLININNNKIYTIENQKLYHIIFETNYGFIDLQLISEINKINNIFDYKLNERQYIRNINLISNYNKIDKKRNLKKKLEKENKINYFIPNKIW
jgi:hypothetical protein